MGLMPIIFMRSEWFVYFSSHNSLTL